MPSSLEVRVVNGQVEVEFTSPKGRLQVILLTPETAIAVGSSLIEAGRDAAINRN